MIWNVVIPILLILAILKWIISERAKKKAYFGDEFDLPKRKKSKFKCASCIHCKKIYDDGVMCQYRNKSIFKNPVHINNCVDFTSNT